MRVGAKAWKRYRKRKEVTLGMFIVSHRQGKWKLFLNFDSDPLGMESHKVSNNDCCTAKHGGQTPKEGGSGMCYRNPEDRC